MRRIYYSYGVSIAVHQMFWQGIVLGGSVALFGRLTHVASIVHNFLSVPLSQTPLFVESAFASALARGEMVTVLVVLAMVVFSVSFFLRTVPLMFKMQFSLARV